MDRANLLITTDELEQHLGDPDLRVVDVRWDLADPAGGRRAHEHGHVPGAVYLDWLEDLSDPDDSTEGQLAPPERFAAAMQRAGIGNDTHVVVYDDTRIFMAPRLAWALRLYGHDQVRVLDGGWPKWLAEGRPVQEGPCEVPAADFAVRAGGTSRVDLASMLEVVDGGGVILDCRMEETWDAAGQHIPGAGRLPSPELVREDGTFKDPQAVDEMARSQGASPDAPVTLYCGGGVSATAGYMALRLAGYRDVRVYDGSWSEWSANADTPKAPH